MTWCHKLLLAIDLDSDCGLLIKRAGEMCRFGSSELHVVHVIKAGAQAADSSREQESSDSADADRQLQRTLIRIREILLQHGINIPAGQIHLLCGEPSFEIKQLAAALAADLVIIGSHSKQDDWMGLPGATTNCVIQGISSDVMAVRI